MKNLASLLFVFFLGSYSLIAQNETCDCKKDLDFVVAKIKKMPSYKKQIKGKKLQEFIQMYSELASKMNAQILIEDCYKLLQQQMMLVNDAHSNIAINSKYNSIEAYSSNLKSTINLDELNNKLTAKSLTDIEGLYNYLDQLTIGVFYDETKKNLKGIVLESQLPQWEKGDVKFIARLIDGKKYNVYHYSTETKTPSFIKSMTFENGRLLNYKKIGNTFNNEFSIKDQQEWVFKQINEDTQYLYFAHFSNRTRSKHKAFFEETKDKLTAKNIIVDLRSNSGGNKKFSDWYLKLLKNKNVYVLTNCFTGSNGEQFTIKLKDLKNGKHLGQTTRGLIAYGMNYGYTFNMPSGYFKMTPTDMNFHEYYKYEKKYSNNNMSYCHTIFIFM